MNLLKSSFNELRDIQIQASLIVANLSAAPVEQAICLQNNDILNIILNQVNSKSNELVENIIFILNNLMQD